MEIWKKIEGYENYKVSNMGNVISYANKKPKEKAKVISNVGYYQVSLWRDNKMKLATIHRLVAKAFINNEHKKPVVNHIDGNYLNNKASNLEWCTQRENIQHAIKNGLWRKFEDCNFCTLNEKQVMDILYLDLDNSEIATQYGVSKETIRRIKKGLTWKHVYDKFHSMRRSNKN